MTLPLTQEIERIESMPAIEVTPTIYAHLERMRDIQKHQSSKGGPVHHDVRNSARSKT